MKISAKQYALALFDLTRDKDEKALKSTIKDFAQRMKKNGHMRLLQEIVAHFDKIYNRAHGTVAATVTTAFPLSGAQKEIVERFIAQEYKAKDVVTTYYQDPAIKGGVVVRVGDEIVDASIDGKLRMINKALLSA